MPAVVCKERIDTVDQSANRSKNQQSVFNDVWTCSFLSATLSGSLFTKLSQQYSMSFSPRICKFEIKTTSDWPNYIGLANQKLCYFQMILSIEKSVEQDQKSS